MKQTNKKLAEEIQIFIRYSVAENEQRLAEAALASYRQNGGALRVMKDFYARLPELRQEAVRKVSNIVVRRDACLVEVDTENFAYLYFCTATELIYLGEKKDGISDREVLRFFGQTADNEFFAGTDTDAENGVSGYDQQEMDEKFFCPSCGVAEGAFHLLGCSVEICPWCDGQITYCNCRFEKLGVEEIDTERQLDRLEILLNEVGRIPFSADHAPSYPVGGEEEE